MCDFFFPFCVSLSSLSFSSAALLLVHKPLFLHPKLRPHQNLKANPKVFLPLLTLARKVILLEIVTVSLMVVPMDLMLEHPMANKFLLSLLTLVILMRVVIQLDIIDEYDLIDDVIRCFPDADVSDMVDYLRSAQ